MGDGNPGRKSRRHNWEESVRDSAKEKQDAGVVGKGWGKEDSTEHGEEQTGKHKGAKEHGKADGTSIGKGEGKRAGNGRYACGQSGHMARDQNPHRCISSEEGKEMEHMVRTKEEDEEAGEVSVECDAQRCVVTFCNVTTLATVINPSSKSLEKAKAEGMLLQRPNRAQQGTKQSIARASASL